MSLQLDGIWKGGLWAPTVWADGVWFEGAAPATQTPAETPKGRAAWLTGAFAPGDRRRTEKDVERDRERFGIAPEVREVIAEVAARQVGRLERDEQKRFEELHRELELRRLEWDTRYLELLNVQRQRLLDAEIAARMQLLMKARNEETLMLLLLAAAAVA